MEEETQEEATSSCGEILTIDARISLEKKKKINWVLPTHKTQIHEIALYWYKNRLLDDEILEIMGTEKKEEDREAWSDIHYLIKELKRANNIVENLHIKLKKLEEKYQDLVEECKFKIEHDLKEKLGPKTIWVKCYYCKKECEFSDQCDVQKRTCTHCHKPFFTVIDKDTIRVYK